MKPFWKNKATKDISWGHILDRTVIHLFSAGGVLLSGLYLKRFIPEARRPDDWVIALCAFTVISLREVHDVAEGNPRVKSYIDWCSWAGGFTLWLWVIHRVGSCL